MKHSVCKLMKQKKTVLTMNLYHPVDTVNIEAYESGCVSLLIQSNVDLFRTQCNVCKPFLCLKMHKQALASCQTRSIQSWKKMAMGITCRHHLTQSSLATGDSNHRCVSTVCVVELADSLFFCRTHPLLPNSTPSFATLLIICLQVLFFISQSFKKGIHLLLHSS